MPSLEDLRWGEPRLTRFESRGLARFEAFLLSSLREGVLKQYTEALIAFAEKLTRRLQMRERLSAEEQDLWVADCASHGCGEATRLLMDSLEMEILIRRRWASCRSPRKYIRRGETFLLKDFGQQAGHQKMAWRPALWSKFAFAAFHLAPEKKNQSLRAQAELCLPRRSAHLPLLLRKSEEIRTPEVPFIGPRWMHLAVWSCGCYRSLDDGEMS